MLAFIDESGYPLPGDGSTWSTLVAVCIPEAASRDVSRRLHAKIHSVYPGQDPMSIELKASNLLNRRRYEHSIERRRMVSEIMQLLESSPITVFAVRMRRPTAQPNWPARHVDPPTRLVAERIELHMRAEHPGEFAKLVFDETNSGADFARSAAMRTYMHATEEGKSWQQILDFPFFVSSTNTPGIQIADLMAGAIRHYQILRDEKRKLVPGWETTIAWLQGFAVTHTADATIGKRSFPGLYTMPDSYFLKPPRRGAL